MGQDLSEADVAAFMKTCDKDGDGVITREEMEDVAMSVSTVCFYDARTSWFE